jgi:tRNA isopentenyl-2-thiomethyl-A-37 hydroxylase MiaE
MQAVHLVAAAQDPQVVLAPPAKMLEGAAAEYFLDQAVAEDKVIVLDGHQEVVADLAAAVAAELVEGLEVRQPVAQVDQVRLAEQMEVQEWVVAAVAAAVGVLLVDPVVMETAAALAVKQLILTVNQLLGPQAIHQEFMGVLRNVQII